MSLLPQQHVILWNFVDKFAEVMSVKQTFGLSCGVYCCMGSAHDRCPFLFWWQWSLLGSPVVFLALVGLCIPNVCIAVNNIIIFITYKNKCIHCHISCLHMHHPGHYWCQQHVLSPLFVHPHNLSPSARMLWKLPAHFNCCKVNFYN
jgi:hypothetical protein